MNGNVSCCICADWVVSNSWKCLLYRYGADNVTQTAVFLIQLVLTFIMTRIFCIYCQAKLKLLLALVEHGQGKTTECVP